jgi:hypothetical protein
MSFRKSGTALFTSVKNAAVSTTRRRQPGVELFF